MINAVFLLANYFDVAKMALPRRNNQLKKDILSYYLEHQQAISYYELVLGALIYFTNNTFKAYLIPEETWIEIDNVEDFRLAENKLPRL